MSSRLDDQIREMMQQVVDESPPPPDLPTGPPPVPVPAWRIPNWAVAVGAAAAVFVLIGGVLWLIGGSGSGVVDEPMSVTTTMAVNTTTIAPSPPVVGRDEWNSILATTKAKAAPPAATCPEGSDPNAPGPVGQDRPGGPGEGPWNNQAAVFDTHQGRIVYLDDTGETWAFDVCTNAWEQMEQAPGPGSQEVGELVYDVDSDRTISFGPNYVSIYDANTNSWTRESTPPGVDLRIGSPGLGAVYDPVSGLVLVLTIEGARAEGALSAYDVDAHTWTSIGTITEPREVTIEGQTQTVGPPYLIGHVAEADRLAFLGFDGAPFQDDGALINPRDGSTSPLKGPDGGVVGGIGRLQYATGGETAYTGGGSGNGICRLDPTTLSWDCSTGNQRETMSAVMVYDPINRRVVLINDFYTWPGPTISDDVWAIDTGTGEWTQLLAPTTPE